MSTRSKHQSDIDQINNIADAKGIDLDDIEVNESTTDEGDRMITFRIMETKAESEEDSVGIQVSKLPEIQTADMTFRNEIQSKMSSLKRHLSGSTEEAAAESRDERTNSDDEDTESSRTRTRTHSSGDGPGASIDDAIADLEQRMDDIEDRVEAIESKADALDGLQKIMNGDSDE